MSNLVPRRSDGHIFVNPQCISTEACADKNCCASRFPNLPKRISDLPQGGIIRYVLDVQVPTSKRSDWSHHSLVQPRVRDRLKRIQLSTPFILTTTA